MEIGPGASGPIVPPVANGAASGSISPPLVQAPIYEEPYERRQHDDEAVERCAPPTQRPIRPGAEAADQPETEPDHAHQGSEPDHEEDAEFPADVVQPLELATPGGRGDRDHQATEAQDRE